AVAVEIRSRESVADALGERSAHSHLSFLQLTVAGTQLRETFELGGGGASDDVDRASDGVAAVERALRALQNFDALDVEQVLVELIWAHLKDVVDHYGNGRFPVPHLRNPADGEEGAADILSFGEAHVRRERQEITRPLDAGGFDVPPAERRRGDGDVLESFLALSRGDHDLLEGLAACFCVADLLVHQWCSGQNGQGRSGECAGYARELRSVSCHRYPRACWARMLGAARNRLNARKVWVGAPVRGNPTRACRCVCATGRRRLVSGPERPGSGARMRDAPLHRRRDRSGTGFDPELAVDALQMELDRVLRKIQEPPDRLVRAPLAQLAQHFELACAELVGSLPRRCPQR